MEEFRYVDIFATKGIEYITVLGFLITFVFFWQILNRSKPNIKEGVVFEKVRTTLID